MRTASLSLRRREMRQRELRGAFRETIASRSRGLWSGSAIRSVRAGGLPHDVP